MKKYLFPAAMLLAAVILSAADNGMVAVGRASTPIAIDGNLDEAAWQNSVALTPFLLQRQGRFAIEQTETRMLWDDACLYVAFRCFERALDPLENRRHEFKTAVTANDDPKTFDDDCVIVILQRGAKSYDFAINANGAVLDCAGDAANLWASRRPEWNSGVKVAVGQLDRGKEAHWTVEMAIPWSVLGGAPISGDDWRFLVGRIEKSAGESSAFQIVTDGFHHADSLGKVKFVKSVPGIVPGAFPALTPGANPWPFTVNAGDVREAVGLNATVQFDSAKPEKFRVVGDKAAATLTLPTELRANGEFTFRWSAENPASLTEFIRSPRYRFRVSANALHHNFKQAKVTVNGQPCAGAALLASGLNTIAAAGPVAAGEGVTVGSDFIPLASGETLRLLLGDSVIWPNWHHDGVAVNAGNVQQILFAPRGVKGFELDDYTMNFDVPAGFEIVGASGYYKLWPLRCEKIGEVRHGGESYTRYAVRIDKKVPFNDKLAQHQWIAVLLKAPEQPAAKTTQFYYGMESPANHLRELPNPVAVKLYPPLRGKPPKKLLIELWTGWLSSLDDKTLYACYGDLFKAAGINECGGLSHRVPGIRHFALISFQNWNFPCAEYLKQHPDQKRVNPFLAYSDDYACSTAMVADPAFAEFFRAGLKAWHEKWHRPDNIHWDYESRVLESYLACFCPRCLEDFRKFAGLAEAPTPEIIKNKYYKEWTAYMNARMAAMSKLFRDAIHAELPGVDYSIYSAYQSEESKHYYGVDWTLLADKVDIAACGYGRTPAELDATRQALGATPLMLGELVYPYRVEERMAPKYASKAVLMRRACDATKGILIYEYPTLDGRTFDAVAAVSAIMADYEEFFLRGDRPAELLELRGFDRADYEVLRDATGDLLIALFNPTGSPRAFNFSLKQPAARGLLDVGTGKRTTEKTVSGMIEPDGIAVFTTK